MSLSNSLFKYPKIYNLLFHPINNDDLFFYLNEAKIVKKKVLYVGVGTGRIMYPLLQNKIDVIGIDKFKEMTEFIVSNAPNKINKVIAKMNLFPSQRTDIS